ncbi:type IV toxin-antitoxin system AbiEi family antitoxin domain-containing protein [Derxia lacustris]|uniref:type IV toxin-antitoxin system AbiEi family antitoxin domain-containing protein n=1 Tax=Derxia lacustris TaxID=764842 RepID=UPI000A16EE42|nr:type IV toxin-antitoxin system AbiEi family antitoxin domain-containing protein [Derxia lacustris]
MKTTTDGLSFKRLLADWPRGAPQTTAQLARQGVTAFRASALARSGWLEHIARGVYALPGETLSRDACLALLAEQVEGLHVAGKTALDWRGVRHNIAMRPHLVLWGRRPTRLPAWFTERFPCIYRATPLFDSEMPATLGLQPLPNGRSDVLVSTPERAVLELLSDVGKGQTSSEARQLVEVLPGLRPSVLDELLAHTTRVKVVRLVYLLASAARPPWLAVVTRHNLRLGDVGWVSVTKCGERIDLRRSRIGSIQML